MAGVGQVVEISKPGYWLKKARGFLEVHLSGEQVGRVPLDDIATVIISVPGCSISTALIDQLAHRNIPVVICGQNYLPNSWTLPVQGHGRQFQVMRAQATLSEPKRKRLWQQVVQAKIGNQAEVLNRAGLFNKDIEHLRSKVRSGDPDNCEAQAARAYWQRLLGEDFRRDRNASGLNAALNYGYTVLRACIARGVSSAGLHPSFSLHHKNPHNPLNLVDDILEPFRPIADLLIWSARDMYANDLTNEGKAKLATLPTLPLPMQDEMSPLSIVAARVSRTIAKYCLGEPAGNVMPCLPNPLDMS